MQDDGHPTVNFIHKNANDRHGVTVFRKNTASTANAQLAASVDGGSVLTTAQVIALRSALEDDDHATANFIRTNGASEGAFVASSKSGVSAGHAQLATSLGVDASDSSLAQLVNLKAAQSSDNGHHN